MKIITLSEYIKIATEKKLYRLRSWRIQMLLRLTDYSKTKEFYLYPDNGMYCFRDGDDVVGIKDSDISKPPAIWRHRFTLLKGTVPNATKDIDTIFGNYINNTVIFADNFQERIPYYNGRFTEDTVHERLNGLYIAKNLTAKELMAACTALEVLASDSDFGVPAASITTFTTDKNIEKRKKELYNENKDNVDDPLVQARMDKELTGMDRKHVYGTSAQDFIISGKQHDVVRKKTMIWYGSETDMEGKPTPMVTTSLEDGLDLKHMPSWVNAARAGSHGRGSLTALGGADVKQDYLAYGSLMVKAGDCKTKVGLPILIRPSEYKRLAGMRLLKDNTVLTVTALKSMIGKTVDIRVPGHCQYPSGFYCEMCMGVDGAKVFTGIPTEVSTVDSQSMDAMMQAAHGKARLAVKIDLNYYAS